MKNNYKTWMVKIMKDKKKIIIKIVNALIFIFVGFITFFVIFKKNNISIIISNIKEVNILYILLAFIFMIIYIACEGINIRRILRTLNDKITIKSSFKYASVGFFFSAITPSASGGDPMQLYFMKKDNLPISHSAISLLIELTSFELICCILAVFGYFYNFNIINSHIGSLKYLVIIGIIFNILYITLLLVMIFSKKLANKIYNIIIKLLNLIHYKKINAFKDRLNKQIEEYHKCSILIKKNKNMLIKVFLTSLIELIVYHMIPYLIYLSFGLNKNDIITFISLSALLYTSVAFLPLPGSMGASEGSFVVLYKMLFPLSILSSAMLLSRAISYYIFVLLTGLIIIICIIKRKITLKRIVK